MNLNHNRQNIFTIYAHTVLRCAYSRQALSDSDRQFIVSGYSHHAKRELLEISKKRKYFPVIAKLFISLELDVQFWFEKLEFYRQRNENIIRLMDQLFRKFGELDVKKVFLYENFGAFLLNTTDLELSSSGDFDLFATIPDRDKIADTLESLGFIHNSPTENSNALRDTYVGSVAGTPFKVNINYTLFVRYIFPIRLDFSRVIEWGKLERHADTEIVIPSKEVLLYLNLLRASSCYYVHMPDYRLYIDMYNCLQSKPDLSRVAMWAKEDGNLIRVAAVLEVCNRVFLMGWDTQSVSSEINNSGILSKRLYTLVDLIIDRKTNLLRLYPRFWRTYKIEALSNNRNMLSQALALIFPNKIWLVETYGAGRNVFSAYACYILRLLCSKRM